MAQMVIVRDKLAKSRGRQQLSCWSGHFLPLAQAAMKGEKADAVKHFFERIAEAILQYTNGAVDLKKSPIVLAMDEADGFRKAAQEVLTNVLPNVDWFHVLRNIRTQLKAKLNTHTTVQVQGAPVRVMRYFAPLIR